MSPAVYAALERLYDEFAAPRPRYIDACPCCKDPEHYRKILSKPLRDIMAGDIDAYVGSAFYTAGEVADWRYYLPRLLELSVDYGQEDRYFGPETTLGKLPLAGWGKWHKSERAAIIAFVEAWYDLVIEEVPADGMKIDDLLCGIARADIPLKPYLDKLAGKLEALVAYCEHQSVYLDKKDRLCNAFWNNAHEGEAQVIAFLRAEPVAGLL
ncbi:hypothetical protein [Asticcacaulis sp. AC402]|uniref:hypothetical protein n=1 Tax=Asticcacaulis sp. AC402 TaxID=1282361 RepID=UPI0003C41011|nr:hypothetical protein [Asticcacaulis sp. AC402]ESQ77210.1 hypothetical protein ABAC402_02065 [Asticcacaulis sp. AC402]